MTPRLQHSYRLLHPLGAGGMGYVWLAEAPILGHTRRYALKFIQPEHADDPRYTERFVNEALLGLDASVSHPNVVTTHHAGAWSNGRPYVVMDYMPGPALQDVVAALAGDVPRIRAVIRDVLCALAHLSAHGLVHRDLSPGNILLGPDGYVKVADFGLAKRHSTLSPGAAVGTLPYASPETLRGEQATAASDLYSVGMILQTIPKSKRWPRDLRRLSERLLAPNPNARGTAQTALRLLARGADRHAMATFARAHAPETARQHLDAFPVVLPPQGAAAAVKRMHRRLGTAAAAAALGIAIGAVVHELRSAGLENAPSHSAIAVSTSAAVESRTQSPALKSLASVGAPDTGSQLEARPEAGQRSKGASTQTELARATSDLWGLEIRAGGER